MGPDETSVGMRSQENKEYGETSLTPNIKYKVGILTVERWSKRFLSTQGQKVGTEDV